MVKCDRFAPNGLNAHNENIRDFFLHGNVNGVGTALDCFVFGVNENDLMPYYFLIIYKLNYVQ